LEQGEGQIDGDRMHAALGPEVSPIFFISLEPDTAPFEKK